MGSLHAWLERLGLGKYASVLAEQDVDLGILPKLSDEDLRELGLPLGARRRILAAIAETPPEAEIGTKPA